MDQITKLEKAQYKSIIVKYRYERINYFIFIVSSSVQTENMLHKIQDNGINYK